MCRNRSCHLWLSSCCGTTTPSRALSSPPHSCGSQSRTTGDEQSGCDLCIVYFLWPCADKPPPPSLPADISCGAPPSQHRTHGTQKYRQGNDHSPRTQTKQQESRNKAPSGAPMFFLAVRPPTLPSVRSGSFCLRQIPWPRTPSFNPSFSSSDCFMDSGTTRPLLCTPSQTNHALLS